MVELGTYVACIAEGSAEAKCDANAPVSLFVYKLFSDAKLGDMTYFRVNTGKLAQSTDLVIEESGQSERFGQVFCIKGKEVSYPLRELGWELGEDINTVLYTVDDWTKNSFTPFHKNVEEETIAL